MGSIASPVIANAFLDHVLDQWFVTVVRQHCRGYCALLRYADDAIAVFEREDDAHRFMRVLPKRLGKFGLRLNRDRKAGANREYKADLNTERGLSTRLAPNRTLCWRGRFRYLWLESRFWCRHGRE